MILYSRLNKIFLIAVLAFLIGAFFNLSAGDYAVAVEAPSETTIKLENPLGDAESLIDIVAKISSALIKLAVPIVVVLVIISGVMFVTSAGQQDKVTRARKTLLYSLLGFAIILIGRGFIGIIESILSLRQGTP